MSFKDINVNWLDEVIFPAIDSFYNEPKDKDLIQRNASERTIVANIYCKANSYLHQKQNTNQELDNLGIDLEYNRNYADPKKAYEKCSLCQKNNCLIKLESLHCEKINPDFIIHQRGTNVDNQVVIEFKKTSNKDKIERLADKTKLIYLTCQQPFPLHEEENYQYHIGFFIDLDIERY
ncbi:MAG: hypothetical protein FD147_2605, partial [Chloroflexi bacterium]